MSPAASGPRATRPASWPASSSSGSWRGGRRAPTQLAALVGRVFELEAEGCPEAVPLACLGRALVIDLLNDSRGVLAALDRMPPASLNDVWQGVVTWLRSTSLMHLGHAAPALAAAEEALLHAGAPARTVGGGRPPPGPLLPRPGGHRRRGAAPARGPHGRRRLPELHGDHGRPVRHPARAPRAARASGELPRRWRPRRPLILPRRWSRRTWRSLVPRWPSTPGKRPSPPRSSRTTSRDTRSGSVTRLRPSSARSACSTCSCPRAGPTGTRRISGRPSWWRATSPAPSSRSAPASMCPPR